MQGDQGLQPPQTQCRGHAPGEQGTTLNTAPEHRAELLSGNSSWNPEPQLAVQVVAVKHVSGSEEEEEELGAE